MQIRPNTNFVLSVSSTLSRRSFVLLSLALGLVGARSTSVHAESKRKDEFVIIINAQNPVTSVRRDFLADAFLKKTSHWEGGQMLRPVDQRPDSAVRRTFSNQVLKRPVSAVRNYWHQRIFSGRELPPPELDSDAAVIRYVAKHDGAVGYISTSDQLSGVKVVVVR